MLTSVKLVDGAREMILLPRRDDGIFLQQIDAPMPGVREVAEDRTDDDGTRDSTSLFGARACSIELLVTQDPRAVEDELTRYLHPRLRPYLVVEDDGWSQARRLMLRSDQFSAPLALDTARWDGRRITVGWKVPDGIWEATDLTSVPVAADISTDSTGLALPAAFPVAFAPTMATGASLVTNAGSTPAHFIARLYGPCTAPVLRNETTGEQIAFTDSLALAAGQYVEIDTRARTAFAQSNTAVSRLTTVDFVTTSWWRLEPGDNQVRYAPADADAGSQAVIIYRPAWL